jgi:hypothetical protein
MQDRHRSEDFLPSGSKEQPLISVPLVVIFCKIDKDKTGSRVFDTAYIKDNNSVAVSSRWGSNKCITIIDIKVKKS